VSENCALSLRRYGERRALLRGVIGVRAETGVDVSLRAEAPRHRKPVTV
jgi:hypothetical protein